MNDHQVGRSRPHPARVADDRRARGGISFRFGRSAAAGPCRAPFIEWLTSHELDHALALYGALGDAGDDTGTDPCLAVLLRAIAAGVLDDVAYLASLTDGRLPARRGDPMPAGPGVTGAGSVFVAIARLDAYSAALELAARVLGRRGSEAGETFARLADGAATARLRVLAAWSADQVRPVSLGVTAAVLVSSSQCRCDAIEEVAR